MTRRDNPNDLTSELRDRHRRMHELERAPSLGHSSVSRGLLRVLTSAGEPLAGAGHADGKSGLLLRLGGEWVTVQEHVAATAATLDARIDTVVDYADSLYLSVTWAQSTADGAAAAASAAQGTADTAKATADTAKATADTGKATADAAKAATDNHSPRIATLEDSMTATESKVGIHRTKINEVIDSLESLEAYVRSQHPAKAPANPIAKL